MALYRALMSDSNVFIQNSKLYLELIDANKKRLMPQNGQVTVLKYSPIWKKMRKIFFEILS